MISIISQFRGACTALQHQFPFCCALREAFGSTGLTIKKRSPLGTTFTIDLANGYAGYLPPPEQHKLGGYTTWRARTSLLEVDAEPKIVDTVVGLLQLVADRRVDEKVVPVR